MKTKLIKASIISAIAVMSLTGCGDKNASMYVVDKQPEVVEEKPEKKDSNYAYITAKISEGADKDKNLGKKCIVEIQGQPIAVLLDDYENEFGYKKESEVTEISTEMTSETSNEDTNRNSKVKNKTNNNTTENNGIQDISMLAAQIDSAASVDEQIDGLNQFLDMFPKTNKIKQESGKKFKEACSKNEIRCVNIDLEDPNVVLAYDNIESIMLAMKNENESVVFMTYSSYNTEEDMENRFKVVTTSNDIQWKKVNDTRYEGKADNGRISVVAEKFDKCILVIQYNTDNEKAESLAESVLDTLR